MKQRAIITILVTCVVLFAAGLYQIFQLRFESGDVYPEYSSLRADPLGTMALCESLEKMPGISVRRDFSADNHLPAGRDTTYLHLAAHTYEWTWMDEELVKEIEGFVAGGGRLAVSFYPETSKPFRWLDYSGTGGTSTNSPSQNKAGKQAKTKKRSRKVGEMQPPGIPLKERWGLEFMYLASNEGGSDAVNESGLALPESLAWHGGIAFTNLPSEWKVIYSRAGHPVVIDRKFGTGSVVMATDSYFLSNEALLKDRHADLLSWWLGSSKRVVFDEAHLGVVDNPGVAALIRKYRLHGLVLGLILLAGLFIWKNAASFVPPYPRELRTGVVEGKDSAGGFVNLLRRNIAPSQIVDLCFAEWKKSIGHGNKRLNEKALQIEGMLNEENARSKLSRDPAALYRNICAVLKTQR
jgi:Domain of unknown function (DUF4350)